MALKKPHYVDNKKLYNALLQHRNRLIIYHTDSRIFYNSVKKPYIWSSLNTYIFFLNIYTYLMCRLLVPRVSNYIGASIIKIAEGFIQRPLYTQRCYKPELISNAVDNCLRYCHNFDPELSKNPFSYFSQIIYRSFLRTIMSENKQKDIESKYREEQEYNIFFNVLDPRDDYYQSLKASLELKTRYNRETT